MEYKRLFHAGIIRFSKEYQIHIQKESYTHTPTHIYMHVQMYFIIETYLKKFLKEGVFGKLWEFPYLYF